VDGRPLASLRRARVTASPSSGEPPEVLFVALASGLGGSTRSLLTLLEHLQGLSRTLAAPHPTRFTTLVQENRCCEHLVVLPGEGAGRLKARLVGATRLACYAARNRRRLVAVHANGLSDRTVVVLAAALAGVPAVVWVHEWEVAGWSRRLARVLRALPPRTRFAAVSEQAREMLVDARVADRREIEVVANPIDPRQVRAAAKRVPSVCTVGYIGAPARYKGFHLLPALIEALRGERISWVIYSGPRSAMPEVWAELERLAGPGLRLEEKVADVREAYSGLDIVVCPSLRESFGRVVAEAMLNGIPVVASDLPPLRDLLGSDEAGVLVAPGDVDAIADAVRLLASEPALRARLGWGGRLRAARYEPGVIARRMKELYLGEPRADHARRPCP
jgi:glycosyltransferase involved in cell wall biosynthesis